MSVVIFVTYCQCGTRHGPYATVAMIPSQCQGCEQQALVKERQVSA
jgi:hypothetical protein